LVANQFVELKASVFKKCEIENLFQVSCSDMVERFQLTVFLLIIAVQNMSELMWHITPKYLYELLEVTLTIFISECIVDWIKHCFITKFNRISSDCYCQFITILYEDLSCSRQTNNRTPTEESTSKIKLKDSSNNISLPFMDYSYIISRRLGFAPLPLCCLVIRLAGVDVLTELLRTTYGICFIILCYLSFCFIKVVISMALIGQSLRHKHYSKNKSPTAQPNRNTPKIDINMHFDNTPNATPTHTPTASPRKIKSTLESLETIERYALYKGKIP